MDENIQLTGFNKIDSSEMLVINKILDRYKGRFKEICRDVKSLQVSLKPIHEKEKSELYEIHILLIDDGKRHSAEVTDRNLFFGLDTALKKVENSISK